MGIANPQVYSLADWHCSKMFHEKVIRGDHHVLVLETAR